jgi:hypothetical protein
LIGDTGVGGLMAGGVGVGVGVGVDVVVVVGCAGLLFEHPTAPAIIPRAMATYTP